MNKQLPGIILSVLLAGMFFIVGCTTTTPEPEPAIIPIPTPTLNLSLEETARSLKGENDLDTIFNIWREELEKNWTYNPEWYAEDIDYAWYNSIGDCTDRANITFYMLQSNNISSFKVRGFQPCPPGLCSCNGSEAIVYSRPNESFCLHDWIRIDIHNMTKSKDVYFMDIDLIYDDLFGGKSFNSMDGFW
jgi:hypothetical protein